MGSLDCFDFHFFDLFKERNRETEKIMLSLCGGGQIQTASEKLGNWKRDKHAENILSERNLIKMYKKFPIKGRRKITRNYARSL